MFSFLRSLLILAWALWFGGMMALLIFVIRLFGVSRNTGMIGAPVLFDTFATNQLIVGGIACGLGTIITLRYRCRGYAMLTLMMLSVFAVAIVIRSWTAELDVFRLTGHTNAARFNALHARSGFAYVYSAVVLLLSGVGWINAKNVSRTTVETAPAPGSPAAASA